MYIFILASALGDLRNGNDANCTYEGANNVLVQQTSNWLLQLWGLVKAGKPFPDSPLGSIAFLPQAEKILKMQFTVSNVSMLMERF